VDQQRRDDAPPSGEESLPFGQLLRESRQAQALTQEALAERSGLSARTIQHLERGVTRPYRDTVGRLARALALSPEARQRFEAAAPSAPRQAAPPDRASQGRSPEGGAVLLHGKPPALARAAPTGPRPPLAAAAGPPLAGRAEELALLERHVHGQGPPVLLVAGEPGIGKSRLLQEVGRRATTLGWTVLWGGCQRRGGQDPYTPLVDALARHLAGQTRAQQQTALAGCAWLVRLLPELAAAPIEPLPAWHVSPEQERRLMFLAVGHYLRNAAGPAGTLLLLDDLQWAGADALDLLLALARDGLEAPVRVVGAYRDSEAGPQDPLSATLAALAGAGLARQRLLRPLSRAEAGQLLDSLLEATEDEQGRPGPDRLWRERVVERAGGVPFFVVSQAQAARLGAEDGPADAVPWDVAQGVRQRVAALPAVAREFLGVAAVVGREVPSALLSAVTAQGEEDVLTALDALRQARLLEETGARGYRFPHDLIRETVEADLGEARRSALHRRIAQALEQGPGVPSAEALAYHYGHTDEHARAALWLERAGDSARAEFANAAALAHYAAARQHLQACEAGAEACARLDEKLGEARLLLGAYPEAQEDFARARAQATDAVSRAKLACKEADAWQRQGELVPALAALDAAEAEGGAADGGPGLPPALRAAVEVLRGEVHRLGGAYDEAATAVGRALVLLGEPGDGPPDERALAGALHLQGRIALDQGQLQRAAEFHRRSLALRERLADQQGMAECWFDLGRPFLEQGDLAQAEECSRRSLALYERLGDQQGIGYSWAALWDSAFYRGNLAEAEEYNRHWLDIVGHIGDKQSLVDAWVGMGRLAVARGDFARAEDCSERAQALAVSCGYHWGAAGVWYLLGQVAHARGELARAEASYRHSLAIFEQLTAQLAVSRCWHDLGEVSCDQGELTAAARLCRQARRGAADFGAHMWEAAAILGQARARLRAGRLRAAAVLLEHGRALITAHGLMEFACHAALLTCELRLRQGALAAAQTAAEEALRLALAANRRADEALAQRLLGQCALARGRLGEAEDLLRSSLQRQIELGASLEAARTRVVLAGTLLRRTRAGTVPDEARRLLADAQTQFAASGAALDLFQAQQAVLA
jgi:transcriptional regulator with XRE-family HTH domain